MMVHWNCEDAQNTCIAHEIRNRAHVAENILHVAWHWHISCLSVERTTDTHHCTGQFAKSLRTQKGGCLQTAYSQNTRSHGFNEPGPHRHDFPLLDGGHTPHAINCCPTAAVETKQEELPYLAKRFLRSQISLPLLHSQLNPPPICTACRHKPTAATSSL